jgi:hypothetical protein
MLRLHYFIRTLCCFVVTRQRERNMGIYDSPVTHLPTGNGRNARAVAAAMAAIRQILRLRSIYRVVHFKRLYFAFGAYSGIFFLFCPGIK